MAVEYICLRHHQRNKCNWSPWWVYEHIPLFVVFYVACNFKDMFKWIYKQRSYLTQIIFFNICIFWFYNRLILSFFLFQNKRVMGLGTAAFLAACGYILYIRLTDEYKGVPTYTSISDDGTLTRRVKQSKWDWTERLWYLILWVFCDNWYSVKQWVDVKLWKAVKMFIWKMTDMTSNVPCAQKSSF